jgi:hypothetical protein
MVDGYPNLDKEKGTGYFYWLILVPLKKYPVPFSYPKIVPIQP